MSTIKEGYIRKSLDPINLMGIDKITKQMKYSVCRILRPGKYGTGFFCKLPYKSKLLPFLVTNNHILDYDYLQNNNNIKISLNNNDEKKTIIIDDTRIIMTNENLDYTLIEIKPNKDQIDMSQCLELEKNFIDEDEQYLTVTYANKSVYVIHYPKDDNVVISYGLLPYINEHKIAHLCNTDNGSSGGPIMSLKDFSVIGIHYGFNQQNNHNVGTFIKPIINELKEYKKGSFIIDNSLNNNSNNMPQYTNINNNNPAQNFNDLYQLNINNISQNNINYNNNMMMPNNNNMNNLNNNEEFQSLKANIFSVLWLFHLKTIILILFLYMILDIKQI